MPASGKQKGSRVNTGAQAILRVLEKKPYYQHRFLGQVQALYGFALSPDVTDITASLFLNSLFDRIPADVDAQVGSLASLAIVNAIDGCPSPSEVRACVAEAVLGSMNLTFVSLSERAKLFLACPPTVQVVADRWLERVIYTTVRRIGRERFSSVHLDDWKREVTDTIFADGEALMTYSVAQRHSVPSVRRDFLSLVSQHG
jgi:hypothetical protein